ncbi:DUF262 domain-containing HNH endonuclease family protein [Salinigranum marinum]|uniref:DUF262 domain-containing protein n=1 Tax=Salinigranum marinum TaxID=1515595 RepID=UPI002989DFD2|nr:DUF262 domain-containing HNH endonuclease family protein [Salinigranum marinum]
MESGKKSLEELTTAGVFHIPDYQRYYSWRKSEWDDLWTDLYTLPEGKQHYFGTVIIQKTTRKERAENIEGYGGSTTKRINLLIDGQQRLTSLTLLVKAISECLRDIAPETEHSDAILNDVEEMEEKFLVEDNIYFLKLLDEEDWKYLKRIIEENPQRDPERPSQQLMVDAKEYFDTCLEEIREDPSLKPVDVATRLRQLWKSILNLELMVYVVDENSPEKATLIFDSVNDRGRALSTFDKTKSFLMRMVYLAAQDEDEGQKLINRIRDAFGEMYNDHQRMLNSPYVEDISDDAVQRYHFMTFFDWSKREDHQTPRFLDLLKAHIRNLREEDPDECLKYISDYTDSLENAFDALGDILSHRDNDDIADLIDRIHKLRHATKFYPLLIKAWPQLEEAERRSLLDAIETFIFRVYSIGNHPNYTGRSSVQTLARDADKESSLDFWIREIVEIMNQYEDDAQFRRTLSLSDLYTKSSSQDLRYLFYFYNEHRAEEEGESGSISLDEAMSDKYTIEHIWPRNPEVLPIDEEGEYASAEQRYDAYIDRLGNLTLASRSWNSTWGNVEFDKKRASGYEKSKLWAQWELQEYDEWSIDAIETRGRELAEEFIIEVWETPETRFTDVDTPEDTISELTEEEQYVFQALCKYSDGRARRVIHRKSTELDGSPFTDPESSSERGRVGTILSRLTKLGLAERQNRTWYPSDDAIAAQSKLLGS